MYEFTTSDCFFSLKLILNRLSFKDKLINLNLQTPKLIYLKFVWKKLPYFEQVINDCLDFEEYYFK